jgi:cytoskeletal protein RodZ
MSEPKKKKHTIRNIIAAVVLVFILFAIFGQKNDKPSNDSTVASASEATATATATSKATSAPTPVPTPTAAPVSVEFQNALKKATSYANNMHMSKAGVYDQLTSEYGEGFSADAAQYAVDNVKADWGANALAKAKSYQTQHSMSASSIYDQLTSEYGEKFTAEEAQYAVANLPK